MNAESPDVFSRVLSVLDNISGWTFCALAIGSAFLIYWPYNVGVDLTLFRKEYGGWLFAILVISLCFVVARVVRKLHDFLTHRKANPTFHFTPIELQCWWSATEQKDGRVFTQMLADCNVLNLTTKPLHFHSVKLIKPRLKENVIQSEINVFRANPSEIDYIPPFQTNRVRISFHVRTSVAKEGRDLKIVADVMDRFGNKQRIKIALRDIKLKV